MKTYVRTCQSCGKQDAYPPRPENVNEKAYWTWAETKCKYCKSESLDYGCWRNPDKDTDDE